MLYMYIYIGVDVREKSHTYTVQYLKCYIKVDKNSTFYISPKQTGNFLIKWPNVEAAMNG